MFLKKWTMKSTENCLNEIEKLKVANDDRKDI